MTIPSLLKLLERMFMIGIPLGLLLLYGTWQWEEKIANSLVDQSIQALQQGHMPEVYTVTFKDPMPESIPDIPYSIVHHDQHFFRGQWYCISFANNLDVLIDVLPYLLHEHEIIIRQVPSCTGN